MTKYNNSTILNTCQIGFEFELFSKLEKKEICKALSKVLGKKIIQPFEVSGFNKKTVKAKPQEKPDYNKYILTPDYSGGNEMIELITGPLPYSEARIQLIKINNWIKDHGWTTDKCGIHLNISFQPELHLLGRNDICNLDRLKFCLSFDENIIYKLFPKRKDNVYAATIKTIIPANPFTFTNDFNVINQNSYFTPKTKYYGVNFLKQEKNYLEFRYIGGADYEKKTQKILDLLDNFIIQTFNIIQNPEYTESDSIQLKKIITHHKKIVESFASYKNFLFNYPKIVLMVDLKNDQQTILTYWNILRYSLYNLIVFGHMKEGIINYDTDMSKIQIKNTTLSKATEIRDYEFFNSYLDGMFYDCDFYDCTIKRSHIHKSTLVKGNLIEESKIITTPVHYSNKLISCYIDNEKTMINGKLHRCIIRKGEINQLAVLDDNCIIIKDNL